MSRLLISKMLKVKSNSLGEFIESVYNKYDREEAITILIDLFKASIAKGKDIDNIFNSLMNSRVDMTSIRVICDKIPELDTLFINRTDEDLSNVCIC